jgi:hypothetical protein
MTGFCFAAGFCASYCGGIGLSGRSPSQASETIHQREPSCTSWIEWMPRYIAFGSPGACRVSNVEKTWHTLPKHCSCRAVSFS